jgi:hypothetical protein
MARYRKALEEGEGHAAQYQDKEAYENGDWSASIDRNEDGTYRITGNVEDAKDGKIPWNKAVNNSVKPGWLDTALDYMEIPKTGWRV